MVVLMEYAPGIGVAQKRKGAEEPGLFAWPGDGDGYVDGDPISCCRATKMRRLECAAGTGDDVPEPASDVMMGEDPPAPSPGAAEGDRSVVVYNDPAVNAARAGSWLGLPGQYRLRPWAPLSAGAEWIRDMLREANSRTVRAVLSGAQEEGGADLAVVPWVAAPAPGEADQACAAAETVCGAEEDADGAAEMDVEVETGHHQTHTLAAGRGEGHLWRWPQHCLVPAPLPPAGQASPAVWSW